jgi:hypothetical protein
MSGKETSTSDAEEFNGDFLPWMAAFCAFAGKVARNRKRHHVRPDETIQRELRVPWSVLSDVSEDSVGPWVDALLDEFHLRLGPDSPSSIPASLDSHLLGGMTFAVSGLSFDASKAYCPRAGRLLVVTAAWMSESDFAAFNAVRLMESGGEVQILDRISPDE